MWHTPVFCSMVNEYALSHILPSIVCCATDAAIFGMSADHQPPRMRKVVRGPQPKTNGAVLHYLM
jgi:hypothetical protein